MRVPAKIGLCLLCVALALAGCGGGTKRTTTRTAPAPTSTPATATSSTSTVAQLVPSGRPRTDLTSIFEDENLLYTDYAKHQNVAAAFAQFKGLGVQMLRVFIPWNYLAPDNMSYARPKLNLTRISSYTDSYWVYLDAIVEQARASHIRVLFDVGAAAPYWALGKDPQTSLYTGGWKPNAAEFGDLMQAIGQRYSGHYTPPGATAPLPRVNAWSVWNEPNAIYLTPNAVGPEQTPYSPRLYRALLDAAWQGLVHSGHTPRTDLMLIGETAPRGLVGKHLPGATGGLLPLIFLRALYCVSAQYRPLTGAAATTVGCPASGSSASFRAENPALFTASGWADHPYSDTSAPNARVPASVLSRSITADYTDFASLSQLETALDRVFAAYGSRTQLPIYATEFGYVTDPPTADQSVSDAAAAAYTNQAEYLSWLDPRIRSYSHYLLVDPAPGNSFASGLERYDAHTTPTTGLGTPKPDVYAAYRMPLWLPVTTASPGRPLEVWGCVRPLDDSDFLGTPRVNIQFAAADSSAYRTVKTVTLDPARGGCYFETPVRFTHSGSVRLSFSDHAGTITSRTQAVTVP